MAILILRSPLSHLHPSESFNVNVPFYSNHLKSLVTGALIQLEEGFILRLRVEVS